MSSRQAFPDYDRYDAVGLAELVAAGSVHPVQLVESAVERIEAVNPAVNAVVHDRFQAACDEAERGDFSGPFAGVPILIKDLVAEVETPVTFGSVFFRDFVADVTSEFRNRIHQAGFVDLGRTNTPEFGLLPTTEPVLHGPTRNPWDLSRSAGGSSGGAAAAVASGMVPLAQGSDGGGSIRIPASACGVFGLKPSRGLLPRHPPASSDLLAVDGAITRTVRDTAAFLDAVRGPTPGEEYWAPPPERPLVDSVRDDPAPLRIAYTVRDFRGIRVHPDCEKGILETASLLGDLGHEVIEDAPALDGSLIAKAFTATWAALPAHGFRVVLDGAEQLDPRVHRLRRLVGDRRTMRIISALATRDTEAPAFEPFTVELSKRSANGSQAELLEAHVALQGLSHQLGRFFEGYDVMLTPVLGAPPLAIGAIDQNAPWEELIEMLYRYVAFTPLANFSGMPAMSVPLHWTDGGLPVGAHFVAPLGKDTTLLQLAAQLERARPWRDRLPPVHASSQ